MIVLYILFSILSFLLLLLVCLLFIPFEYYCKGVRLMKENLTFAVVWFWGLFGFQGVITREDGFNGSVIILGFRIKVRGNSEKKEKPEKKKKKKSKRFKIQSFLSPHSIRLLLATIQKSMKHILPGRIEGYGRLGFEDPYYTGLVSAFLESLKHVHLHSVDIEYCFDEEVYEGELYIEGRLFLVYLAYLVVRFFINRITHKLSFN